MVDHCILLYGMLPVISSDLPTYSNIITSSNQVAYVEFIGQCSHCKVYRNGYMISVLIYKKGTPEGALIDCLEN